VPYRVVKSGTVYRVVTDEGRTVGTHSTLEKAKRQLRALYANVKEAHR